VSRSTSASRPRRRLAAYRKCRASDGLTASRSTPQSGKGERQAQTSWPMRGLRPLESQESAQPQLSSVPTLAAAVNRVNLTTHVPRMDSNSVNLSFGKSGKSSVHAERYQTLSLKLISSLKTRGIKDQVSSLSSPNHTHDFLRISRCSPVPCRSSFNRGRLTKRHP
jgi:hypothetical protein